MSTLNPVPIPIGDRVVKSRDRKRYPDPNKTDPNEDLISDIWAAYLSGQSAGLAASPSRVGEGINVTAGTGSVGATDFSGGSISGGSYQIDVYARIVQPGGISSSLTITFDWVDGGVVCSRTLPALTGNLVTTVLTDPQLVINVDPASPIRYSVTYASSGAPAMQYKLLIFLLRLGI